MFHVEQTVFSTMSMRRQGQGSAGAEAKSNMAYISRLSAISLALPPDITAIPLLQLDSSVMG